MSAQSGGVRAKRRGLHEFHVRLEYPRVAHRIAPHAVCGVRIGRHARFSGRKWRHPRGGSPGASRALGSAGTAAVAEGFDFFTRRTLLKLLKSRDCVIRVHEGRT